MALGGNPWIAVDDDCTFGSRMCENQVHNRVHITGLVV